MHAYTVRMDIHTHTYYLRPSTHANGPLKLIFLCGMLEYFCGIGFFEVRAFQRYVVCLVWTMLYQLTSALQNKAFRPKLHKYRHVYRPAYRYVHCHVHGHVYENVPALAAQQTLCACTRVCVHICIDVGINICTDMYVACVCVRQSCPVAGM